MLSRNAFLDVASSDKRTDPVKNHLCRDLSILQGFNLAPHSRVRLFFSSYQTLYASFSAILPTKEMEQKAQLDASRDKELHQPYQDSHERRATLTKIAQLLDRCGVSEGGHNTQSWLPTRCYSSTGKQKWHRSSVSNPTSGCFGSEQATHTPSPTQLQHERLPSARRVIIRDAVSPPAPWHLRARAAPCAFNVVQQ